MSVKHRVDALAGKRAVRAIDRQAARTAMTVHDPNTGSTCLEQDALSKFFVQFFTIVIARDGDDRRDLFEQFDRNALRQVTAVENGLHLGFDQATYERRREARSKPWHVRIGHETENEFALRRRGVIDGSQEDDLSLIRSKLEEGLPHHA
jgi:hypothetical protein